MCVCVCVCVCVSVGNSGEQSHSSRVISILNPTQAQDLTNTHFWIFTYMILTSWFDDVTDDEQNSSTITVYFPECIINV